MGLINILAAAAASWVFGAIWYMSWGKQWMAAAGIKCDADGKPVGGASPTPFILSALCMIIVAGFMRHIFGASGISTFGAGTLAGLGVGAFFISPWVMINNAYTMRPFKLTLIDGGYATFGCAIIGGVLTLF
jgi:hypothetical protein